MTVRSSPAAGEGVGGERLLLGIGGGGGIRQPLRAGGAYTLLSLLSRLDLDLGLGGVLGLRFMGHWMVGQPGC